MPSMLGSSGFKTHLKFKYLEGLHAYNLAVMVYFIRSVASLETCSFILETATCTLFLIFFKYK